VTAVTVELKPKFAGTLTTDPHQIFKTNIQCGQKSCAIDTCIHNGHSHRIFSI